MRTGLSRSILFSAFLLLALAVSEHAADEIQVYNAGIDICGAQGPTCVAEAQARHDGFGCRAFKRRDRNGGLLIAPRKGSADWPERPSRVRWSFRFLSTI